MNRRTGDSVKVDGSYQHEALTHGNAIQRFWHASKHWIIQRYLPPQQGQFVLDVGCGSGTVSGFLGQRGAQVLGIDGNPSAMEFATRTYGSQNVSFRLGLVDEDFQLDRPADSIYCLELIEHIYRPQAKQMLGIFYRLLKPGGRLFITTPNYRSAWPLIEWAMDRLRLSPPLMDEQHVTFYNRPKLATLCRECGFAVDLIRTSCFLAPWVSVLNWKLARTVHNIEQAASTRLGSILICVLTKPISAEGPQK